MGLGEGEALHRSESADYNALTSLDLTQPLLVGEEASTYKGHLCMTKVPFVVFTTL